MKMEVDDCFDAMSKVGYRTRARVVRERNRGIMKELNVVTHTVVSNTIRIWIIGVGFAGGDAEVHSRAGVELRLEYAQGFESDSETNSSEHRDKINGGFQM